MIKNTSNYVNNTKTTITLSEGKSILREDVEEPNKISKHFLNLIIFVGSIGFLITGISSYFGYNLVPFLDAGQIIFFPQGITMSFYGTIGLLLSINQTLILYYGVGEGYNEFNKKEGTMKIFRKGFPGKNSNIDIVYPLDDILRH